MQLVGYYSDNKGMYRAKYNFAVSSIKEAREAVQQWFFLELECPEWNIRSSFIDNSQLEARIDGYCADEHIILRIEDDDFNEVLEDNEWSLNALV